MVFTKAQGHTKTESKSDFKKICQGNKLQESCDSYIIIRHRNIKTKSS